MEEEQIIDILKEVIDPELAINIVDLGLVYDIRFDEQERRLAIDMTLSSPGCPLGDVIFEDVHERLTTRFPGIELDLNLVWDPPWSPERLTPAGREALGR